MLGGLRAVARRRLPLIRGRGLEGLSSGGRRTPSPPPSPARGEGAGTPSNPAPSPGGEGWGEGARPPLLPGSMGCVALESSGRGRGGEAPTWKKFRGRVGGPEPRSALVRDGGVGPVSPDAGIPRRAPRKRRALGLEGLLAGGGRSPSPPPSPARGEGAGTPSNPAPSPGGEGWGEGARPPLLPGSMGCVALESSGRGRGGKAPTWKEIRGWVGGPEPRSALVRDGGVGPVSPDAGIPRRAPPQETRARPRRLVGRRGPEPLRCPGWIPAFAGMTETFAGMTERGARAPSGVCRPAGAGAPHPRPLPQGARGPERPRGCAPPAGPDGGVGA